MFDLVIDNEAITIYEHEDAETLIKELASAYWDDIEPISRGGRGRNKYFYYRFPCSFDIETTTIRSGQLDYYREDGRPVAFPYLFQFNIYGRVIMTRTYDQAADIFKWLGAYFIGSERRKLVIFDHNAAYEYGFMKDIWELDYEACFALDVHHPVTLALTNGIIIKDSYKLTNMSLETLTKDWAKKWKKKPEIMDYGQLRTPYTRLDDNTLIYSALDVLSLSDAIGEFLKAHNTGVWTKCPTSTSFIRQALKKTIGISAKVRTEEQKEYFKTLERCKLTPDIYAMLQRQARGGNTHLNRRFTGITLNDLGHMDITSSYPTQLICYPEFVNHYWRPLDTDCSIDTIKLFEANNFSTLFDVVLIRPRLKPSVPVPYLATYKCRTLKGVSRYSDNGRYIEGAEMLETTIFGIEWPIIEKQYEFDDIVILRGYFARKGYLPDILRRFILNLYADKTQLKNVEGKEVEYMLSKSALNSVYGCMYTRIIRAKCIINESGIFEGEPPDIEKELAAYQKSPTRYFLNYSWGGMCATLGRLMLQRYIDACGKDFVYCDTDSVFYTNPETVTPKLRQLESEIKAYQRQCGLELVYNDIKGRPHELGGIDEEERAITFKSWGAKKYVTITPSGFEATVAGVPKFVYKRSEDGTLEKQKTAEALLKSIDNFELGFVFAGRDTNKLCLWYNDNEGRILHDEDGRPITVLSNVAMLPVDYILGLSDDYTLCLQIEGINTRYSFKQANDNNQIEDFIN